MATLYVTADYERFVPEGDPEAAFGIASVDIDRLGLRDAYDDFIRPPVKAQAPPKNKQAAKPADKGR